MKKMLAGLFYLLFIWNCQNQIDYVSKVETWSSNIKMKIISDCEILPNRIERDSIDGQLKRLKLWKDDIKLKEYLFINGDTAASWFYSKNQNFQLIRELCPTVDRNWEGIQYKREWIGIGQYRYCNGELKEQTINFNGKMIGKREEYNERGDLINSIDFGNIEEVREMVKIEY